MMTGLEIAVIGMAGKFPGAKNIHELWDNLKNGIESIAFFSQQELESAGVEPDLINNPGFVKASGILEDIEYFDPFFFEHSLKEAKIMNPQMRIFHECSLTALEDSAYDPAGYKGLIGLYAGSSSDTLWETEVQMSGESDMLWGFSTLQYTRTNMICSRIAYRLGLNGPVFSMYTGCSTSLVAIHLACQGLLNGECDMALAGGVTISFPQVSGYLYQEGMIYSRDGHCRAFDAAASGTNGGSGAAAVVLKRLEDAVADRDHVYAVIKGSAINNDGNRKVGFTAPSIKGQVEVIRAAHKMADAAPESIGYIETHGTGTILGDPIEIKALNRAFNTNKKKFCAIGSVKTNLGHLDSAAGVTGFIKTVMALTHRVIPPSLHFKTPNPELGIENSPFYVNTKLQPWKNDEYPLRAGVSSFGIGGTNAHVVLEEAPAASGSVGQWVSESVSQGVNGQRTGGKGGSPCPPSQSREYQLLLLSAKTEPALERITQNLAAFLKQNLLNPGNPGNPTNPGPIFADVAYTLQVGRQAFGHRRMVVCPSPEEVIKVLESANGSSSPGPLPIQTSFTKQDNRPVIFMFPGQGAQYVGMGLDLYRTELLFRQEIDRCFEILKHLVDYDIKEILYPGLVSKVSGVGRESDNNSDVSAECLLSDQSPLERGAPQGRGVSEINQTKITQPVLFIFEYALAKLLINWGIKPVAMIGHSIGEYTAACLAGVFSLENALKIVALRGKLMQQMPTGSMLGVLIPEKKLAPFLSLNKEVSLAAVNSPSHCVVSGPHQAVKQLAAQLKEKGIESKPLHTSHAFHSRMMEPILETFEYHLKQIGLNKPKIPFISNLTGEIISDEDAVDPGYWVNQLQETVKFSRGIKRLLKEPDLIYLEVGPGRTLSTFVKKHRYDGKKEDPVTINLVRHPKKSVSDTYYLLSKLGQLWLYGVKIDGQAFYAPQERHRISLPTYSFDRIRCWPGGNFMKPGGKTRLKQDRLFEINDKKDWFYVPSWERAPLTQTQARPAPQSCWLVFIDTPGFGERLAEKLKKQNQDTITVFTGEEFAEIDGSRYNINPPQASHYDELFNRLARQGKIPGAIIHLWGITPTPPGELDVKSIENALDKGFNSLIHIARAISGERIPGPIRIGVVTDNLQEVTGEEVLRPEKAAVLATVKIIPLEYPNITCQGIDILPPAPGSRQEDILMDGLVKEFTSASPERFVAYRGKHRWTQFFKRVRLDEPRVGEPDLPIKEGSVCLVTGGGGDTAADTAGYLLNRLKARVILFLPPGEGPGKMRQWEEAGAPIMIANVDRSSGHILEKFIKKAKKRFGRLNALIHIPGNAAEGGKIQEISPPMTSAFAAASMEFILVMNQVLKDMDWEPDFMVLFSSVGTAVYPSQAGNLAQCAVNDFLDAFSYYRVSRYDALTSTINNWLHPQEIKVDWLHIFNAILQNKLPRVLLSPVDLNQLVLNYDEYETWVNRQKTSEDQYQNRDEPGEPAASTEADNLTRQRQGLSSPYAPPETQTEKVLVKIWRKFFGIKAIGIYDDFLELGGDSLQAMTITTAVHQTVAVKIPIDFFFSNPFIQKLAQYIDNHAGKDIFSPLEPVEKKEYYQLSPMQETILAVHRTNPRSVTYNISLDFVLNVKINKKILTQTFRELIKRHESFRTSFEIIAGEPRQKIHDNPEIEIEYHQAEVKAKVEEGDTEGTGGLAPLPEEPAAGRHTRHHPETSDNQHKRFAQHRGSARRAVSSFIRPFDLNNAPLLRVGLIKTAEDKYILLIDMHHIISDGFSGRIIINELGMYARGEKEKLPPLKIQYKDYTQWYNNELHSGLLKKQEAYWLKLFETKVPTLNLPLDYERPAMKSFAGNLLTFEIEEETQEKIKKLTGRESVTITMLFLCIYNIFLSKLTGQEDIVILTPFNGRSHRDLEPVIGMFVKTIYFRNYPQREKSFLEVLREVKTRTLEAYENQDYQPEMLADKVAPHRDPRRNPITDVAFTTQQLDEPRDQLNTPPPGTTPHRQERNDAYVSDLILIVLERKNGLDFRFAYRTELFKKDTIETYSEYFKNILATVLENNHIKLKDLRISDEMREARANIGEIEFDL
ncbi:MAG: condensation domain-containing protein [Candidatus Aminicenantes bacterium]|jgi:acyl transferase domain-containing protein/acyl carrier protein